MWSNGFIAWGIVIYGSCTMGPKSPASCDALPAPHLRVQSTLFEQCGVSATLDNLSIVQYEDLIGLDDGVQSMGNDDDGLVSDQFGDRLLHVGFVLRIERCCRFIKQYDGSILQNRTRDGKALPLPPDSVQPPSPMTVS